MRLVGQVVLGIMVLLLVVLAVASLLPRQITVTREVVVAAPPERIFAQLNSLQKAAAWSPWTSIDPKLQTSFAGPPEGVGNRMTWTSADPRVGSGTEEIIVSVPGDRVESAVESSEMGVATSWRVLKPDGKDTRVTWGLLADLGSSPMVRYRGLALGKAIGDDFEKGLANLKALVETEPPARPAR